MDGDGRTFWKGSEYFLGLERSDFNTSGFPGHMLFLESEVPGDRATEMQTHREAPKGQRPVRRGQQQTRGGGARKGFQGREVAQNTGETGG